MVNINKLIKQLTHDEKEKREEAILALGDLRDERAVESLIKVVNQDTIENRTYAIIALSNISDHRAIETLIYCLMDNAVDIRLASSRALGKFTSPQAISALLVSLLKDPNVSVKSRAALSLGAIGSELAVEDLMAESKLEHPAALLYSIDSALKMIARNNGYEDVEALFKSIQQKKQKHAEVTPASTQLSEREELLQYPNLWPYVRKYVYQQLEGIQTILSIDSDEVLAEKKIADILGEKFWRFSNFMERKMSREFSQYQTDLLWQMCWDTSKPIRSEIFNMIKDHKKEVEDIDRYRVWLDKVEDEKETEEKIEGKPIIQIKEIKSFDDLKRPKTQAAEARTISGDLESIMKKYSTWKKDADDMQDLDEFGIESE